MFSVIDNNMGSYPSECIERFVSLALRCCQEQTEARPSMSEVVRELENIWKMTPDADVTTASSDSMVADNGKVVTPSSNSRDPCTDISGSNLLSGVMPSITPR